MSNTLRAALGIVCLCFGCGDDNPSETPTMPDQPPSSSRSWSDRHGFAAEWSEEHGSFHDILVRAPAEEVIAVLLTHDHVSGPPEDLLSDTVTLPFDDLDSALYVYQLAGQQWTQLEGEWLGAVFPALAPFLSDKLQTLVYHDQYEDTGGAFGYDLFENGELVEAYRTSAEVGIYDGPDGAAERQRKLSEGWQIDRTNSFAFLSLRGRELDIDSSQHREDLLNQVAEDLGMYVLTSAWWAETESRHVMPFKLDRSDFTSAVLLRLHP